MQRCSYSTHSSLKKQLEKTLNHLPVNVYRCCFSHICVCVSLKLESCILGSGRSRRPTEELERTPPKSEQHKEQTWARGDFPSQNPVWKCFSISFFNSLGGRLSGMLPQVIFQNRTEFLFGAHHLVGHLIFAPSFLPWYISWGLCTAVMFCFTWVISLFLCFLYIFAC